MIQRHTILLNIDFTASDGVVNSSALTTIGGYQVNNVQGLGGGITNSSNIRGFLADVNNVNDFIVNDFFSYLTGSTTTIEFAEIYNSDQNLSNIFNDYYDTSIVNNQTPSTSVIDNSLSGTTGIIVVENWKHNIDGIAPQKGLDYIPLSINDSTRMVRAYSALTTFTNDESYYVPVFIPRNAKQMAGISYDVCDEIVSLILNQPQSGVTSGPILTLPSNEDEPGLIEIPELEIEGGVPDFQLPDLQLPDFQAEEEEEVIEPQDPDISIDLGPITIVI